MIAHGPDRALAVAVVPRARLLIVAIEIVRITGDAAILADQRIVRQRLAALACNQHFAFCHHGGCKIEDQRRSPPLRGTPHA